METATYLLFVLGSLGATDIALYHSFAHGIRSHPDSRAELVTHSLRGPTYAALFLLVPNFALHGVYFWCLVALFAFDVAISLVDFALERRSRQFLGGLPSGEYVLHTIIAMFFGALVAAVGFGAGEWAKLPSEISYAPADVPLLLRCMMAVMAVLVFASGVQDGIAALRLWGQELRSPTTG
jgi:hypothetical protein